jgi:hypothetical protein
MLIAVTGYAPIDAALTEIKIARIAYTAVIVLVGDRLSTIVAVDAERSNRIVMRARNVRGNWRGD